VPGIAIAGSGPSIAQIWSFAMTAIAESVPTPRDALQVLREDWQHVERLLGEVRAPEGQELQAADRSGLIVRLCTRLEALSRLETELLYPELGNVSSGPFEQGQRLHEQLGDRLRALLAVSAQPEPPDRPLQALADQMIWLRGFEEEQVYPLARRLDRAELGKRMLQRRGELLKDLSED
jgi:hypothetical protein